MEEALRKAHDELEIRVQERTAELARANEALKAEIDERRRVEEALRLDEMRLEALWELSQMSGGSDEQIARFVLDQQLRITGSTLGSIEIMREDGTVFSIHSSREETRSALPDPSVLDSGDGGYPMPIWKENKNPW